MPLPISVIIPCHNDAPTLAGAVQSALAADAGEVLIVNDASEDDTIHVALSIIGQALGRVRLINSPLAVRGGVCFARNLGISRARNRLIVPLDADDQLTPTSLKAMFIHWHIAAFVYGGWTEDGISVTPPPPIIRLSEKNVTQATWLFSKADWERVGGYDPTFELGAEDYAFMIALVELGLEGVRIDSVTHIRRSRPDGRAARCYARRDAILGLLREHFPKTMGVKDHA